MIAKVKIAPFEHWCDETRKTAIEKGAQVEKLVGTLVCIEVGVPLRRSITCGGLLWPSVNNRIYEISGILEPEGETICEHMLEMD